MIRASGEGTSDDHMTDSIVERSTDDVALLGPSAAMQFRRSLSDRRMVEEQPSCRPLNFPVRYALLLSLRPDKQDSDLYTPIANQLRVPVPAKITTT